MVALFLYGCAGLGKASLLQAIAPLIKERDSDARVA
jgi:chromosomal replication initiation ATPase DnaA